MRCGSFKNQQNVEKNKIYIYYFMYVCVRCNAACIYSVKNGFDTKK